MLDTLTEPSEVADKFYNTADANDSEQEQSEVEDSEAVEESDIEEDGEELEGEETEEEAEDEDGSETLDVFGQEVTREEFETMQKERLMHSDYTKKSQANAIGKKQTEALNSELTSIIAEFKSQIVNEASEEHLKELLDDGDTAEYLRLQNQNKTNKSKLKAAEDKQSEIFKTAQAEESQKLVEVMKEWADPKTGQTSRDSDIATALAFATEVGFTTEDLNKLADHKVFRALIDAGKYRELKKSKPGINKRKTPVAKKASKKPAQGDSKKLSAAELFYAKKD